MLPAEPALRRSLQATPLRQPDARSCGASVGVLTRVLSSGAPLPHPDHFAADVLQLHRRLTSTRDAAGRLQAPWPRALGTPPWALAHHLGVVTGHEHRVRWVRLGTDHATATVEAVLATGRPVPLYVGSATLPRHVVLVLPTDRVVAVEAEGRRTWSAYDPATGRLRGLPVTEWVAGRLATGWPVPWAVVLPR